MTKRKYTIFWILFYFLIPFEIFGMEIYRFVQKDCLVTTGVIVSVSGNNIGVLAVDGEFKSIDKSNINSILIYYISDNPIRMIHFTPDLKDLMVDIWVKNNPDPLFTGWPIRFVDDLIFFLDLEGKIFTLDMNKIIKIDQPYLNNQSTVNITKFKEIDFGFGRDYPECSLIARAGEKVVQPMRILSDPIKIEKLFLDYAHGFDRVTRFRQRTLFYAKPVLYKDQTQIGVSQYLGKKGTGLAKAQEMNDGLPLFFQWSDGKPYLYQHQSVIGNKPSRLLPTVEPMFGFSSDLKAHLFHGSFAISMNSPVPGNVTILPRAPGDHDYLANVIKKQTYVFSQFNYMALSGIDYGPYSYSAGFFYPVFALQTGGEDGYFREVLASKGSPSLRFQYTKDDYKISLLYSNTHYDITEPQIRELVVYSSSQLLNDPVDEEELYNQLDDYLDRYIKKFDFTNHFIRLGWDWDPTPAVHIGIDQVFLRGIYHETIFDRKNINVNTYRNSIEYNHLITSSFIRHQFGNRVALSFYCNYFIRNQKSKIQNINNTTNENKLSLLAMFEFLL